MQRLIFLLLFNHDPMRPIDAFFLQQAEPTRSCIQALRSYLLLPDLGLAEMWKYGMPFYYYRGKMCFYIWIHKKYRQPYIGIVEGKCISHPDLLQENRARMKILLLDPEKDLPVEKIGEIMKEVMKHYK